MPLFLHQFRLEADLELGNPIFVCKPVKVLGLKACFHRNVNLMFFELQQLNSLALMIIDV